MDIYRLYGAMDVRKEAAEKPVAGKGEALVRTAYCGICGSDLPRIINGEIVNAQFPCTLGHEFSGIVEAVGEGCTLEPGDHVSIAPLLVCGKCVNCKNGNPGQCISSSFLGLRVKDTGGFAEYNVLPEENLVKLPRDVSLIHAAMTEPVTVALHALSLMHFTPEKPLAVIGAGTIGMLVVQCARALGCKTLYVFDISEKRLELAKKLGASYTYNTGADGFLERFLADTDGYGSPQVAEAVGIESTILLALEVGSVMCETAIIGEVRRDVTIPAFNFYRRFSYRQQSLHGVYQSYTGMFPGVEFKRAAELMHGGLELDPLIYCVDSFDNMMPYIEKASRGEVTGKMIFSF